MAIKMPHAVKPADSEQRAAAFISGAGAPRSADRACCRTGVRENDSQYALRRGAFETHRPRREKSGDQPNGLAACGCVEGA